MIAEARTLGLLLVAASLSLLAAYQMPGDVFLDFGPNDSRYVHGFREDFEIDEPTLIHWSTARARVRLPVHVRGAYDVTLRYKRHIAHEAALRVYLGGELADTFVAAQSDFVLRTMHDAGTDGAFELELLSQSVDPRPLGLALDWLAVQPERRWFSVVPTAPSLIAMLGWVAAFYLVPRLLGFSRRGAVSSALSAVVLLAGMAVMHKLWPIHAATTLGWRAHACALVFLLPYWLRRRDPDSAFAAKAASWALLFVYVGFAVRLFALFHPDFYYPDVRTHSKFVSVIWVEGLSGFFGNFIENQHKHLLGLQLVDGRWLAFPYPPLLYLSVYPLSLLELPVEDWMKLVPTTLVALEAVLVLVLARALGISPRAAALGVLLHATARVVAFRLAVASYAAMFGHFWDVLAVLYLTVYFDRMERPSYALGFAALVAVSLLSYAGSALVLGIFVPALCLSFVFFPANRPPTRRLVAIAGWSLFGALAAISSFYWQYVPELLGEPAGAAPGPSEDAVGLIELSFTPLAALSMAAHRLRLFYGIVFAALACFAVVRFRGRLRHPLTGPLIVASVATYLGLNFLRAGLGATHIFQFSKDDLVVLPLIALALGTLLDALWERRFGKRLALLLAAGWIGWGGWGLVSDVRSRFIRPDYPYPPASTVEKSRLRRADDAVAAGTLRGVERLVGKLE